MDNFNGVGFFAEHHGLGMMSDLGWVGLAAGWLIMVVFWLVIILGLVALIKFIFRESEKQQGRIYICAECEYEYEEKEWAIKCQKWCSENKSCNLDIIKHGNAGA